MNEQERNRALIKRWFEEVWNQGREETIDELAAADSVIHGLGEGGRQIRGPDGFRGFYYPFRSAFSNFNVKVEDTIAEGDKVVVRLTFSGTHTGDGLGVAPTNRPFTSSAIVIVRIQNGQITDSWNEFDAAGMMQQLNPPPAPAGMKLRA
jgi:steroid delta-isomerase-like uncharacterized protein